MKHFIQRFCFTAFLFCNVFTASLYAQDIYAGTDASIIPKRTIEDKQPDFDPLVPGCTAMNAPHVDLTSSSFAVSIHHHLPNTFYYGYKPNIKYELQLMDSLSNNIGLPVIILPPSQTSLSQHFVIVRHRLYKIRLKSAADFYVNFDKKDTLFYIDFILKNKF